MALKEILLMQMLEKYLTDNNAIGVYITQDKKGKVEMIPISEEGRPSEKHLYLTVKK